MLEPPGKPYSPEPGSTLADMKETAELEEAQQYDEEVSAARGGDGEPLEHADDFEGWLQEQDEKEATREWAHSQRILSPQFASTSKLERPAADIDNKAYKYAREQMELGDRRPQEEIEQEFYLRVYPDLGKFLASRTPDPKDPYSGLYDFLFGVDLESSQ